MWRYIDSLRVFWLLASCTLLLILIGTIAEGRIGIVFYAVSFAGSAIIYYICNLLSKQ